MLTLFFSPVIFTELGLKRLRIQELIQKITDKYIAAVDASLATKESELMEI